MPILYDAELPNRDPEEIVIRTTYLGRIHRDGNYVDGENVLKVWRSYYEDCTEIYSAVDALIKELNVTLLAEMRCNIDIFNRSFLS